jgi:hypothetical protein
MMAQNGQDLQGEVHLSSSRWKKVRMDLLGQ